MRNASEKRALELAARLASNKHPDVRVTLRISPEIHDRMKEIQAITGVMSINDVVKNALFFYDAMVQENQEGNDIYVISPDGEKVKYPVFSR